ncbi:klaroid protein [Culicoides brevitarsis]|uniref:klaroid protein n=1 Tax=Culicoides brevitarsis TaxID=469753 RepID=UPI00307C8A82
MSQKEVEQLGVETRSRSRSKTPSRVVMLKDVAKNPAVETIVEESEVPRSAVKKVTKQTVTVTQNESHVASSEEIVSSTTTVVTSTARKVRQKTSQPIKSPLTSPIQRQSKTSPRKSKEVTQNEENMLLETSIESISNGNTPTNFAYKEYKEAGEYWNKYPKTDYTYSELSQYRREIAPGQVCMPNMSRKSLELHHDRVVTMIQKRPEEESFIRKRYQNSGMTQRKTVATSLQYDSGDELDYNHFQRKTVLSSSVVQHRETIIRRVWTFVTTVISTIFYYPVSLFRSSDESLYRTRYHHEQGFLTRITNRFSSVLLNVLKRVYLIVSTILLFDTWLLLCRSTLVRDARRRRFLLLLLFLLPLLLLGAFLTSLTKDDAAHYAHYVPASLPKFSTQPLISYLTAWSWPTLPSLSLSWLFAAFFARESHSSPSQVNIKESLRASQLIDDSHMNQILAHIDAYIDKIVAEKLHEKHASSQQEFMQAILNDDRLLVFVRKVVHEHRVLPEKYELTDADVERIVEKVKLALTGYLQDMQKTIKSENAFELEKVLGQVSSRMSVELPAVQKVEPNIDEIIAKLLESQEFGAWLLSYLNNWHQDSQKKQQDEIQLLKQEFEALRVALTKEIDENLALKTAYVKLETSQDGLRAEMAAATKSNVDALLNDLTARLAKLESSQENVIDERIRKHLLLVFEHPGDENVSLADLIVWIKSIFVTKDYLEERLAALNKNGDAKLQVELNKVGAGLLDEVLLKVRSEMSSHTAKQSMTEIDEASITRIVRAILAVYDADKTGLPDFALETAGGQVISTRCTQFYQRRTAQISIFGIPLWYQSSTPRIAITPSVHPGQCWAFTGFPGYLVIQLSRLIHVTGFTVEHIPKTLAPNGTLDSAPKDFTVMGLTHEFDKEPAIFGTYQYAIDGEPLQYFPVQNKTIVVPYEFVEMRIDTNHGNTNYTCLYRIRVHGIALP